MTIIKCSIPEILNEISMVNIKRIESLIYELRGQKINFIEYITKYIDTKKDTNTSKFVETITNYYFYILNNEIIGMARCYPITDGKLTDILITEKLTPSKAIFMDLFIINKKHRKKGFGSELFNYICNDIKHNYLSILIEYLDNKNKPNNINAASFWHNHKFKLIKTYSAYGSVANLCYSRVV